MADLKQGVLCKQDRHLLGECLKPFSPFGKTVSISPKHSGVFFSMLSTRQFYSLLTTYYSLFTSHYKLPTAYCPLPTAYCRLPIAYCPPPIAYCLLSTAYCLLPTVQCLLPLSNVYRLLPAPSLEALIKFLKHSSNITFVRKTEILIVSYNEMLMNSYTHHFTRPKKLSGN